MKRGELGCWDIVCRCCAASSIFDEACVLTFLLHGHRGYTVLASVFRFLGM